LTPGQAFDGSDQARIGHLNDCFLKNNHDSDTYRKEHGLPPDQDPNNSDRRYVAADSQYVMVGGETCGITNTDADRNDPDCQAPAGAPPGGARALSDLAKFHWNYLNRNQIDIVDELWKPQQCYDTVVNSLGYRFELLSSTSSLAFVGPKLHLVVSFTVRNIGWAVPTSVRPVKLVLRERVSTRALSAGSRSVVVTADPRRWEPGVPTTVVAKIDVTNLPSASPVFTGASRTYDAYVQLPDVDPSLNSSAYAIQFANIETWTPPYGNKLKESYTTPSTPPPGICCA
jgi:hypothetical protein